jgi:hypothetical protein
MDPYDYLIELSNLKFEEMKNKTISDEYSNNLTVQMPKLTLNNYQKGTLINYFVLLMNVFLLSLLFF